MASFTTYKNLKKPEVNGDIDQWGNYLNQSIDTLDTDLNDKDRYIKKYVKNESGGTLNAGTVVKFVGDTGTESTLKQSDLLTIENIDSLTDNPFGVIIGNQFSTTETSLPQNIANNAFGYIVKEGRVYLPLTILTDSTGITAGDDVYSTDSGTLTLTNTGMLIGKVLEVDGSSGFIMYVNLAGGSGGSGSGSGVNVGTPEQLNSLNIDGAINAIDTDIELYHDGTINYAENIIITIKNDNVSGALINISCHNGTINNDDYILYNTIIGSNEVIDLMLPVLTSSDYISIKSNQTDVKFKISGSLVGNSKWERVGSIDIDGTTNTIDTDILVATAATDYLINYIICNKTSENVLTNVGIISSGGTIANNYITNDTLTANETIFDDTMRGFGSTNSDELYFKSDTTDVNIILYGIKR